MTLRPDPPSRLVTDLLSRWSGGCPDAADPLFDLVYDELRRRAARHLRRERPGHTLRPTALVHEAYLRLAGQKEAVWINRAQFFAVASRMMRHILVDHARARSAAKREGIRVALADAEANGPAPRPNDVDLIVLDRALEELAALDGRPAQIVELRYFGGLTLEEVAATLAVSRVTVSRDLRFAQAWLHRRLAGGGATP